MSIYRSIIVSVARVAAIGIFFVNGSAALAVDSWGTAAGAFNLNCTSADCSGGGVSGGDSMFPPDVTNYQGAPASNGVSGSLGTASSTSAYEAAAPGLATMRSIGEAVGGTMGAASAETHALDYVTYSGPSTTLVITVELSGSHVEPTSGANNSIDGIFASVLVFTDAFAIDEIDSEMSPRLFCIGECYNPDHEAYLAIENLSSSISDTITLNLDDGDGFYIYGRLTIGAAGGGSASSLNSLTYSFSSTAGLTSLAGAGVGTSDTDGDSFADDADNCIVVSNPDQTDSNADGYGNACDGDLNNDGITNAIDLGLFKLVFFTGDADADLNSDGVVNTADLGILRTLYFLPPGPSAFAP